MKRSGQRIVVLIDTQNMYHSAKHLYGAHLNFGKLVESLVGDRVLLRAIAYVATSKAGDEKGFLGALTANGIEIKSKDVIEFASGERKADWDVGMAIDAVKLAHKADCIILVTGDGDFVPLVEYLQNNGVIVEVAAFSESTSKLLRESVDDYFDISHFSDELLIGSGRKMQTKSRAYPTTPIIDDQEGMHIPEDLDTFVGLNLDEEDENGEYNDLKPVHPHTPRGPHASHSPHHHHPGKPRKVRVTT
jgi:uncharacterized LabA/DUF88 family protein